MFELHSKPSKMTAFTLTENQKQDQQKVMDKDNDEEEPVHITYVHKDEVFYKRHMFLVHKAQFYS